MKSPLDYARGLLQKAEHDLVAARATLATGQAFDTICYHAQQAVEKSFKAVLASHDIEFPKRHDLGELLDMVKPYLPDAASYEGRIVNLMPYAVEVRYDVEFNPSADNAQEALFVATTMYELAKEHIESSDDQESDSEQE